MKLKITILILTVFSVFQVNAQTVTISDANFMAKLLQANTGIQIARNLSGQWFKIDANSDGLIQTTEAQQVSALYVNFSNISSISGIASFTNLKVLSCFNNTINSIDVSALSQLQELYCYDNSLTSLVVLGSALKRLDCFNNTGITAINFLGLNTLEYLDCRQTSIVNLNTSNLTNLETIVFDPYINAAQTLNLSGCTALVNIPFEFSGFLLTSINFSNCTSLERIRINNVDNATTLNFSNCTGLSSLNVTAANSLQIFNVIGCNSLNELIVTNTSLSALNISGLNNLSYLVCDRNALTTLNVNGLPNLQTISCGYNQLSTLDVSGLTNLTSLYCSANQLLTLNLAGLSNLNTLSCDNNQLLSLDISECVSIADVNCANNQLLSIFMKNGKLEGMPTNFGTYHMNFANNPILLYICADEGEMASVQGQVDALGYANCQVNSYCSFSPGGVYYTIQGTSKLDANSNGCDASDMGYANLKYNITNGTTSGNIIADNSGNYNISVIAGTHTVTPTLENPTYFSVSPANIQVSFPVTASPFNQDFCIAPNGNHPDLEITLIPIDTPRPGFNVKYKIVYKNKGNQTANGQITTGFQDDVMDLVSSNPVTSSQALNALVWDYSNL